MVQPYRVGFCPCCGDNIMVADTNGRFNAFKPTFRQIDLEFGQGSRVRTIMCSKCFENGFDKNELLATITHENTQACTSSVADHIKTFGCITGHRIANSYQGGPIKKRVNNPADTVRNVNQIQDS